MVSGPVALSTELEHPVTFSLSTIAAAIVSADTIVSNAISAVETAVTDVAAVAASVKKLVTYIPSLMETFENAYAAVGQADNGAGKLAGVLAALEAVAAKIAADWNDSIKAIIANIVAQAKAAFNAVASISLVATTTSATA